MNIRQNIRSELHRNAEQSPAQIEMARRRLLARISRDRITSRDYTRYVLPGVLLAAAAAMAVILFVLIRPADNKPQESVSASGLWMVKEGDAVSIGRNLAVPDHSGAKIVLDDGTVFWLGSNTRIRAGNRNADRIRLMSGSMLVKAVSRESGSPGSGLVIESSHGRVLVHGTVLSVFVNGNSMSVRLHEGQIDVESRQDRIGLAQGHRVDIGGGKIRAVMPLDYASVLQDLMIVEKTFDLDGPPVPDLSPGPVRTLIRESPRAVPVDEGAKTVRKRKAKQRAQAADKVDAVDEQKNDASVFADPEFETVRIERKRRNREEALFIRAYDQVRSGNHAKGREILEQYLAKYPEGRYWRHIHEILGE